MLRIWSRAALAAVFTAALVSAQRGAPIPQQLVFTPYHASGIYDVGEMVGWTVTPGPVESTYSYKWTIRRNNAVVLKEGTLDLSSGKDNSRLICRNSRRGCGHSRYCFSCERHITTIDSTHHSSGISSYVICGTIYKTIYIA